VLPNAQDNIRIIGKQIEFLIIVSVTDFPELHFIHTLVTSQALINPIAALIPA
jgi:hypothetical protein